MNKKEPLHDQAQGLNQLINNEMQLKDNKSFVYKMCFGVFYNTEKCHNCDTQRQCSAVLFVVGI